MIRLTDIHKVYGAAAGGTVLRNANLEIATGEFVAILGKSGSGKTTLLNIIGGLDRDFTGEAIVEGHNLQRLKDRELSRFRNHTIAFVFQTFNLLPHLTCGENVAYPAYFGDAVKGSEVGLRAREAMERVGIVHKASSSPGTLSGGERQRVAIARAIFQRPRILLADEPTGNLDPKTSRSIVQVILDQAARREATVLMVTHDHSLLDRFDRVIDLEEIQ